MLETSGYISITTLDRQQANHADIQPNKGKPNFEAISQSIRTREGATRDGYHQFSRGNVGLSSIVCHLEYDLRRVDDTEIRLRRAYTVVVFGPLRFLILQGY